LKTSRFSFNIVFLFKAKFGASSERAMDRERLEQQIAFVREVDKLKTIHRQTLLTDYSPR